MDFVGPTLTRRVRMSEIDRCDIVHDFGKRGEFRAVVGRDGLDDWSVLLLDFLHGVRH